MSENDTETQEIEVPRGSSTHISINQELSTILPPASEIEKYETVIPGSAERILTMVERQSEHRQRLELKELEMAARDSLLGLGAAFIFSMTALGGAVYLTVNDYPITGSIVGVSGIAGVVSAFLQRRKTKNSNEE